MSTPKNLITYQEFSERKNHYQSEISSKSTEAQTESVWFDYQDIKEYISYIEKKASEKNIEISGLRFHLIGSSANPKQISIALSPTLEAEDKGNTIHVDFDPNYSTEEHPASLLSLLQDPTKSNQISAILNKGNACPPHCPTK